MNFKDLSIKRKITYLYLPFVVIPMIIYFFLSTNLYEDSIIKRSLINMEDNNALVSNRLDGILSEAGSGANYLTISINTLLNNQEYQGRLEDNIKQYNLISNELTYATLIYENLDSIAFYDVDGRLYYTDHRLAFNDYKIIESNMYAELETSTGNVIWSDLSRRDFLTRSADEAVVTLGKKIWNINTGQTIGYLYINITENTLTNFFDDQISDYSIYNNKNELVSSYVSSESVLLSDEEVVQFITDGSRQSMIQNKLNSKLLLSKTPIERVDWMLFSQTDLDDLTTDFNSLLVLLSFMLLGIIVFNILMSTVLNKLITDPIIKLKGGIEEISKGNFDYRFNMKTNDEIGLFAESFNHMSEQIKALLSQIELEEEQKRTFELALIQQQIKPHFLYNTLDIILKLSQMGQDRKAQKVTKRLADYYKNSLSCGSDIVGVDKEIKITKDYLELQKIRYSDILDYEINIKHSLEGKVIPKLTLQPLVENAIYHGLKYKNQLGKVTVYDEVTEDGYYLIVKDDGVGIKKDKVALITTYLTSNEFEYDKEITESFGMRNVNHRLRLFFGDGYGITMVSEENVGTEMRIRLPKDVL